LNPLTFVTGTAYNWEFEYPGGNAYLWNGSTVSYLFSVATHNANYTQWNLTITPGLKWSDGTPVTTTDILTSEGPKFAFNSTYNFEGLLQHVTSETALNSTTVQFNLNESDAYLLNQFALDGAGGTPILPASLINSQGAATPNLGTDLSMGPFYVYNYTASSTQMVMYRNPYWGNVFPAPKICEIQVSFVDTLSLTTERLEAGSADLGPIDPSTAAALVASHPYLHVLDEKAVGAASLEYNDSIAPFNNLAFRQALVEGIDQNAYIQSAFSGYAQTAYNAETSTPSSAGIFFNPNLPVYNFSDTKALQLLATDGITKGSDGYLHYANGTAVTLNLWTDTDNTEDTAGAAVVQTDLQNLGFHVTLTTTSAANIAGDYSANTNGIRNGIILFSGYVLNPPNALVDGLPGCDVEFLPPVCSHVWFNNPTAQAQYASNLTGVLGTAVPSQEAHYLWNIQSLEASQLPAIILAYPDFLWGYSTQNWTNWPNPTTGHMDEGLAEVPNMTAWESLTPVQSIQTSTGPTSGSTSSSGGIPEFPFTAAVTAVFAFLVVSAYMVLRRFTVRKTIVPAR
ncbi:MAG: ABC transporter substrate-binding protein, partial [Nitrososphaerota archaeon]|nr:ABC transporter substrate-binding protein [Nitrososphaerota archaeon]